MSFLSSWFERTAQRRGYQKAAANGGALTAVMAGGGSSLTNMNFMRQHVDEKTAMLSSWVFSNVDTIGKLVAESDLTVKVQKPGGRYEPQPDHPFASLFLRPNPHMSKSFLLRYTSMWLQLRGSAAWLLVTDKSGELTEIWPLPSDRISPVADEKLYISGYNYTPDTHSRKEVFIPAEYICYFREPSIFSYREGMSKLDALQVAIKTDQKAAAWNLETFVEDVALRTLISLPSDISRGLFNQVKDEILKQLVEERKRYIIARGGEIKAETIGLSQKDMEFLAGREFTREEIDRVFGFPAGFWAKEATEANSRSALNVVIGFSVWPELTMIADEITAQILPRYYENDTLAEFRDIRVVNQELKLKQNNQLFESLTINEVRKQQGMTPHPNKTYGEVPWSLRADPRIVALFVPATTIADGTLGIEEIGSQLRSPEATLTRVEPDVDKAEPDVDKKSVRDDWDRYTSIAWRQLKAAKRPEDYEFFSQVISRQDLEITRFKLCFVKSKGQIKAAMLSHHDAHTKAEHSEGLVFDLESIVRAHRNNQISQAEFQRQATAAASEAATDAAIAGYGSDSYPEEVAEQIEVYETANVAAASRLASITQDVASGKLDETALATVILLWANRVDYIYHFALLRRPDDPLLTWETSPGSKSCSDCLSFSGQTRKASEWLTTGYTPQSPALTCGGWNCGCELVEK